MYLIKFEYNEAAKVEKMFYFFMTLVKVNVKGTKIAQLKKKFLMAKTITSKKFMVNKISICDCLFAKGLL